MYKIHKYLQEKIDPYYIYFVLGAAIGGARIIGRKNPEWKFELNMLALFLALIIGYQYYRKNRKVKEE